MAEKKTTTDTKSLNLYQKINAISVEIGKMEKTGTNSAQKYSFIEQSAIVGKVRVLLKEYGMAIIPETVDRKLERFEVKRYSGNMGVDTHVQVISKYTLVNTDNPDEKIVCEWDGGEAIDSGDKATNKAITASEKYFYMKLFKISDKDDPDAETHEPVIAEKKEVAPVTPAPAATPATTPVATKAAPSIVAAPPAPNMVALYRNYAAQLGIQIDEYAFSLLSAAEVSQGVNQMIKDLKGKK